jgi:FKBP-type peptidyl-prolyl cis-trans isomerase
VYKLFSVVLILGLAAAPACAQTETGDEMAGDEMDSTSMTEDQKTFYALGLAMSQSLGQFDLSAEELESVQEGLTDGVLGNEAKVDLQEYGPKLQTMAQQRAQAATQKERDAGMQVVDEAAAEAGAVKTESGMVYTILEEGSGDSPSPTDTVQVHYKGTLRDGTTFDSSYDRGQPATFPLNQVIPCWTEGVQQMKVGGKAKLVCPPDLAYGDRPNASIPAGSTLTFEVELLDIVTEGGDDAMDEGESMEEGEMMEEGGEG